MTLTTEDIDIKSGLRETCHEFLSEYYDNEIKQAVLNGEQSLEIDYMDMLKYSMDFADDLIDFPKIIIAHLELELQSYNVDGILQDENDLIPRISNVSETTTVSNLRSKHKEKYIGVRGQVQEITQVKPKVESVTFRCEKCAMNGQDTKIGPIPQFGEDIHPPGKCAECGNNNAFTAVDEDTVDHQVIILGEEPGKSLGAEAHTIPVHVEEDLAGTVNPGDRIQVNGLVTTKEERLTKTTSTRRPWLVKGQAIDPEEVAFEEVQAERIDEIERIATEDEPIELLRESLEPGIIADNRRKQAQMAVLLSMASGVRRNGRRGDINLFLLGDKGTGKSQLLKRAVELAPKSIKASGKGATAAGLTATARPSEYGEGYTLDAGALVLANGGLAAIDEFDKMDGSARKSMHEALEDQEVPINKAGINTVLETRTAVLAAANPNGGTVNRTQKVSAQVNLGSPLLSRFDLILLFLDRYDEDHDRNVAMKQLTNDHTEQPIDDELISEYIAYARNSYNPTFESEEVKERLSEFYVDIRQRAGGNESNANAVDPRMTDALRRLSEASARLRLSETIEDRDVDLAIHLMRRHIGDLLLDNTGEFRDEAPEFEEKKMWTQDERVEWLKDQLRDEAVGQNELADRANKEGIDANKIKKRLEKLREAGEVYEPSTGEYTLT